MAEFSECRRDNLCVDCTNTKCLHCGKIEADCPKLYCDNTVKMDCKNCDFIKDYVEEYRRSYERDGTLPTPYEPQESEG